MERQIVLDRRACLDRLDLQGGTDVGEHGRAEWQRLRVVLLPSLVLCSQIKGPRVLEVGREHDSLVTSLTRKLDAQVPGVEGDEGEVEVLRGQVLCSKGIEAVDGIPEGARITNVLPGERRQACCTVALVDGLQVEDIAELGGLRELRNQNFRAAKLTAKRSNGRVDGLHQDALAVKL